MTIRTMAKTLGVLVVMLVFPLSAIAQPPHQTSSQPAAAPAAGKDAEKAPAGEPGGAAKPGSAHATSNAGHPSLAQVAADCEVRCQRTTEAINDLDRRLAEARASSDPARIKTLLDQMERPLGEMRQHMLVCTDRLRQAR